MKVLILGGTSEASTLGRALADDQRYQATISLAGRTQRPAQQPLRTRVGGFGGAEGLTNYLIEHRIRALMDATHPFATQITRNAEHAAQQTDTPLLIIQRPAWQRTDGDRWTEVPDSLAAAGVLGSGPRRVLLTIGQKDLVMFTSLSGNHYVIRSVEAPRREYLPLHTEVIVARGPFTLNDETALLRERRIDVLVTKNSGGAATAAKLTAARLLKIPVIMISRPTPPTAKTVATVAEALKWLEHLHAHCQERGE
jgi:precorrin-6A/cobalt-precorrin-6A reductase